MKTVLLTGATGGIGKALVKELGSLGYIIIAIDKDESELNKLNSEFNNIKSYIVADLSQAQIIPILAKDLESNYDHIDVLINCAGVGIYNDLENLTEAEWDLTFNVNIKAPFFLSQKLLPLLRKSEKPIIMNIGSEAGTRGRPGRSVYTATKFAMRGFSLSLSQELKDITTTLITLGSVMTNFGKLNIDEKKELQKEGKKYLTPEEVAKRLVEILESDEIKEEYVLNP
ncbi:SDR family oxidoreductase [Candidatus Dojkabacteria bacterium]|uniref:SDR family oxidoreductase n=1 Tax=Candidatus Dojkabacteria bacterium TaxID=2099670 RepID=A0A955LAB5_9BACT|nr:SDR family oxidoreductase [Candidatus Dojkabacteria bacterium]